MRRAASPRDLQVFFGLTRHDRALALPVLFHHLRVDKIPRTDEPPKSQTTELAQLALRMLAMCLQVAMSTNVPRIISSVRDHWDITWAWFSFLLKIRFEDVTSKLDDSVLGNNTEHHANMTLLLEMTMHPDLRLAMESKPDLFPLLIHVWQHEEAVKGVFIAASDVVKEILIPPLSRQSNADRASYCSHLPRTLGSSSGVFVQTCLQRISGAANPSEHRCKLIINDVSILLSCSFVPTMHRLFLAKGSVALVLRLMRRISIRDIRVASGEPHQFPRVALLMLAIRYLERCWLLNGLPIVLQILEGRLLVTLFKLVYHLQGKQPIVDADCATALQVIIPFLIHRPILLHARKSLKTIGALDPPGGLDNLNFGNQTSALICAWNLFLEHVTLWTSMKLQYVAMEHEDGCQNPTVRPIPSSKLQPVC